jgi:two-component system sensor histidine kinase RpfC
MRAIATAAGEWGAMGARLGLALALCIVALAERAQGGGDVLRACAPMLLAWLAGNALLLVQGAARPASGAKARGALAFALDVFAVAAAMIQVGGAAAWLFPLFFWMSFGAAARLDRRAFAVAVALCAGAFALVIALTPFWRANGLLAGSLLLTLAALPFQGARLLRQAARARAEAERANRAKTLFLASVGHELRTPLTAILGLAGMLENSTLDAARRDMALTLSEAARELLRQIEHLLSSARDEIGAGDETGAGSERAQDEAFDLFALALSTRALLAVEAEAKGLRLGLMIEAHTPRHIRGDRRRVQEMLRNVAGNAVKFTAAGAVAIRIGARRRDDGLWLELEVSDTGPGIAPQAREHIFEPFRQGDASVREKFGGAGLGLAIVRRNLDALGGEIALESVPGAGARFRLRWPGIEAEGAPAGPAPQTPGGGPVCLPLTDAFDPLQAARSCDFAILARGADEPALAEARRVAAGLAVRQGAPRPRKKILLAEDNALNGRVLEKILAGAGHETVLARDGEAALTAALSQDFDAVLLDLNMPRLGGLDVARLLAAARPSGAPVLALTADDGAPTRRACLAAGMAGRLCKPIAPEALFAALDAAQPSAAPAARGARGERLDAASLDPAALSALDRLGGGDFVRELLVQFACDGAQLVEELCETLAQGDIALLRRRAHALESMAGNMGALALANLCRAWRVEDDEAMASGAARARGRLLRRWRSTQQALGRALGRACAPDADAPSGTKTPEDALP